MSWRWRCRLSSWPVAAIRRTPAESGRVHARDGGGSSHPNAVGRAHGHCCGATYGDDRATAHIGRTSAETDREALVALYNATDGPGWDDDENWLTDAPLDDWRGVEIDDNGRVTELALYENELSGEIPPELGSLANLVKLELSKNELSGEIPPELGSLANLERLYLWGNQLSGEIPPELGSLSFLERLYLGENELSGEIPPSWVASPTWSIAWNSAITS